MPKKKLNDMAESQIIRKFHLLPRAELDNVYVSSLSKWPDRKWTFEPLGAVRGVRGIINWDVKMPLGYLTDPPYIELLDCFKRLAFSLLVDRQGSRLYSPLTLRSFDDGLTFFANWLTENGFKNFGFHKSSDVQGLLDDITEEIRCDATNKITLYAAYGAVWILQHCISQAKIFRGIAEFPGDELFLPGTAYTILKNLLNHSRVPIPPVPEEVYLRVAEAIVIWVQNDENEKFISLVSELIESKKCLPSDTSTTERSKKFHEFMEKYRYEFTSHFEQIIFGDGKADSIARRSAYHTLEERILMIIRDITSSCIILIHMLTGMRAGEISRLRADLMPDGVPYCIVKRRSSNGLLDIYFLRSTLVKTVSKPIECEWVAGTSVVGSDTKPIVISAVDLLMKLYAPWRRSSKCDALICQLPQSRTVPYRDDIKLKGIHTNTFSKMQKEFIMRYVDFNELPEVGREGASLRAYIDSKGAIIRGHQWRKNFAIWLFRFDSKLIPAIAEQFKHISLAMAENSYIGNDPQLLEELGGARHRETVSFFYEASKGSAKMKGKFATEIENFLSGFIKFGMSEDSARKKIGDWVEVHDIKIHYAPHGKCLISCSPQNSKCWEAAEISHWSIKTPNYRFQSPQMCTGCKCFVTDASHANFWKDRFEVHYSAWTNACKLGVGPDFEISRARASQAKTVLNAIGILIPAIEIDESND